MKAKKFYTAPSQAVRRRFRVFDGFFYKLLCASFCTWSFGFSIPVAQKVAVATRPALPCDSCMCVSFTCSGIVAVAMLAKQRKETAARKNRGQKGSEGKNDGIFIKEIDRITEKDEMKKTLSSWALWFCLGSALPGALSHYLSFWGVAKIVQHEGKPSPSFPLSNDNVFAVHYTKWAKSVIDTNVCGYDDCQTKTCVVNALFSGCTAGVQVLVMCHVSDSLIKFLTWILCV